LDKPSTNEITNSRMRARPFVIVKIRGRFFDHNPQTSAETCQVFKEPIART